ncbi:DNA polymerase III subunit gamma/tau [Clostridium cochlearium]|uniref:DNA polymerase III subunit gamma/tau n=1 Tax=Clostridium cochlearium TaxID=1494 RepID=UPI0018479127|nr:DNA polymerase III subunit gamma/tau [Clostridium cochlearium]NMA58628.1 DNA polymerase III subunit gamma/tau [Clostridium cochlearium]
MLYNDFRPTQWMDIIGQQSITEILKNQIKTNQFSHAYLFCGTRGTGKTTSAKVLSKAVNCLNPKNGEPCGECDMCKKIEKGVCVDIIEMDAASHRKIDDMRNIINTLQYPPAEAKYRVIILDEVHMLTTEAVNAFLKTLEEPPSNVIFILATTDPQKLPITILSRCQKFNFKRINSKDIFNRLKFVAEQSSINVEDKGLQLIAKVSDGAMRDALSLLEQVKSLNSSGTIQYNQILNLLGASSSNDIFEICTNIFTGNILKSLSVVNTLDEQGKDFILYTKELIKFIRNILMAKVMGNSSKAVIPMPDEIIEKILKLSTYPTKEELIYSIQILQEAETKMENTSQVRVILELAIIKIVGHLQLSNNQDDQNNKEKESKNTKEPSIPSNKINKTNKTDKSELIIKVKESKEKVIYTLKNTANSKCKAVGIALEKSNMTLNFNQLEIKIKPDNPINKKLITEEVEMIKRGFAKFLQTTFENVSLIVL